jgi:hypothetical protein
MTKTIIVVRNLKKARKSNAPPALRFDVELLWFDPSSGGEEYSSITSLILKGWRIFSNGDIKPPSVPYRKQWIPVVSCSRDLVEEIKEKVKEEMIGFDWTPKEKVPAQTTKPTKVNETISNEYDEEEYETLEEIEKRADKRLAEFQRAKELGIYLDEMKELEADAKKTGEPFEVLVEEQKKKSMAERIEYLQRKQKERENAAAANH